MLKFIDKNMNKIQKLIIILALIASGILFVSSLGFVQECWGKLRYFGALNERGSNNFFGEYLEYHTEAFSSKKEAVNFYYNIWDTIQRTNNCIFYFSIYGFVMVAVACICGNYSRRHFYISNLISGLLYPSLNIIGVLTQLAYVIKIKGLFNIARADFDYYYNNEVRIAQESKLPIDGILQINSNGINYIFVVEVLVLLVSAFYMFIVIRKFVTTNPYKVERKESVLTGVDQDIKEVK